MHLFPYFSRYVIEDSFIGSILDVVWVFQMEGFSWEADGSKWRKKDMGIVELVPL